MNHSDLKRYGRKYITGYRTETQEEKKKDEKKEEKKEEKTTYTVKAGTFKNKENAELMKEKLKQSGIDAIVVVNNN